MSRGYGRRRRGAVAATGGASAFDGVATADGASAAAPAGAGPTAPDEAAATDDGAAATGDADHPAPAATDPPTGADDVAPPSPRDVHRRLLGLSRAARLLVAGTVACGALAAATVIVQAWVVADVVGAAVDGRDPTPLALVVLAVAVAVRALAAGGTELLGRRAAERAGHALRVRIAARALGGRADTEDEARRGDVVTAAVQGVDALGDYYARAVPAIALAGAVPLAVVAAVAWRQPVVGGLLAITLPVLVVFMVLVGRASAEHARERQRALAILGAHFLEVVRALPTLRAHGRERAQARTLDAVAERYRAESLSALRVAFLSALVLELFAMLGIAIAAATTGVLLATGHADLATGLFVLLLAPEVYTPLRSAGQRFHAAEDGAQAARRAFAFLDEGDHAAGPDAAGDASAPDPARDAIVLRGVAVAGSAGRTPRLVPTDVELAPGSHVALTGASGAGKTTLLAALARLRDPDAGTIRCGEVDVLSLPHDVWWRRLAWLPQRPGLPPGTLRDALRAGAGAAWGDAAVDLDDRIRDALALAGADDLVASLPDGLDTLVGPGGRVLSAGQTQRLALAGALASTAPVVLLDEPTAHLDAASAERAAEGIVRACAGRTLVVSTHDPVLAARCDVRLDLSAGRTGSRAPAAVSGADDPVPDAPHPGAPRPDAPHPGAPRPDAPHPGAPRA
ncbi:MAG: thiol reductant ABC exporter subunit CydD, partial [Actinobacteria bacterium]|nr:thiol reductant ABC exporter subunit CydD [Actinomycetota bacterium]